MHILHTESSKGLGGQELRILREAEGMRKRGHKITFAIQRDGALMKKAREAGFTAYPINWKRRFIFSVYYQLSEIIADEKIDCINTHSSKDSWIGGVCGKLLGIPVIRTRHLSTPIRKGMNSRLLYRYLPKQVVTTCESAAEMIRIQADLTTERCRSIPTGIEPATLEVAVGQSDEVRQRLGWLPTDTVVGTLCVMRSWKGIEDLLEAALILKESPRIKWLIVGDGPAMDYFKQKMEQLGLQEQVAFVGYQTNPAPYLKAMDVFALVSRAHEGVSQAILQAGYLSKPLIATTTGGLPEICLPEKTGKIVNTYSPTEIADAVKELAGDKNMRINYGTAAHQHVLQNFTMERTLDLMDGVYTAVAGKAR